MSLNLKMYNCVATGGTFDILHLGHLDLLKRAFEISKFVVIGLTSDDFAKVKLKKTIRNNYEIRLTNLELLLSNEIHSSAYQITKLEEEFGPLMLSNKIECLVASSETGVKGEQINKLRADKGLKKINLDIVTLRLADDGLPISSSRIRNNLITLEGNLVGSKK